MSSKHDYDDLKNEVIGPYERQLKTEDSRGAQLTIGPNHPVNWNQAPVSHAIVALNQGAKWFEIANDDYVARFGYSSSDGTKGRIYVVGSTGNDNAGNPYTIVSAASSSGGTRTRITVTEAISSAVADGVIMVDETLTLPVKYELQIPENAGAAPGSRGETIEWGLPNWLKPELEIKVEDHDMLVREWLRRWKAARTFLRLFQWGEWTGVGRIGRLDISRPIPTELTFTVLLRGIRVYKMPFNHNYATVLGVDGINDTEILNVPFVMQISDLSAWSTATELYGSEVI